MGHQSAVNQTGIREYKSNTRAACDKSMLLLQDTSLSEEVPILKIHGIDLSQEACFPHKYSCRFSIAENYVVAYC